MSKKGMRILIIVCVFVLFGSMLLMTYRTIKHTLDEALGIDTTTVVEIQADLVPVGEETGEGGTVTLTGQDVEDLLAIVSHAYYMHHIFGADKDNTLGYEITLTYTTEDGKTSFMVLNGPNASKVGEKVWWITGPVGFQESIRDFLLDRLNAD